MFPVVLDLNSRTVVVFGGGEVATRRAAKLSRAGAKVRVVSRKFSQEIKGLQGVELVEAEVDGDTASDYLGDAFLVVAATDDQGLNSSIEEAARKAGALVNRADAVSDVVFPAVMQEGDVIISVSTSGRSPGLAKAIKKRLKKVLDPDDLAQLELQEYLRKMLKMTDLSQKDRESILRDVLNMPEILDYLKRGDLTRAKETARRVVDAHH